MMFLKKMMNLPVHLQIILAMVFAGFFGVFFHENTYAIILIHNYIKPFGTLFLNSLKMTAIPLVFTSLLLGIGNMENASSASKMGFRAILMYVFTTFFSAIVGVSIGVLLKVGKNLSQGVCSSISSVYSNNHCNETKVISFEGFISGLIPDNLVKAMSSNTFLLQVVVSAAIIGYAMLNITERSRSSIIFFCGSLNDLLIEVVKVVMKFAPLGVFALVSSLLMDLLNTQSSKGVTELLYGIAWYAIVTIIALLVMTYVVYSLFIKIFVKDEKLSYFFRGIAPVQILAFSTSSSSATLPSLIKCVEQNLQVSKRISNFVLPLGCGINLDGSVIYMSTSIIFLGNIFGIDFHFSDYIYLIVNVSLASFGIGFPGGGLIAISMILQNFGLPVGSIALIMIPERILDMCRTTVSISGDAMVAFIIDRLEKKEKNNFL